MSVQGEILMNSDVIAKRVVREEGFVLLVDGIAESEYQVFAEAVKAGLKLRRLFPDRAVEIRDAVALTDYPVEQFPYLLATLIGR
jgi:hypothetical protein